MDNWIIILTYIDPHEAHLAKNLLESEGFNVIIKDELTVQENNFHSTTIGGLKLLVRKEEAEQAYILLKKAGYITEEKKKHKIEVFPKSSNPTCPYCNSNDIIAKKRPGYYILFFILLIGFFLPFLKKSYYCFHCEKEWRLK